MARVNYSQTHFTAGVLSPRFYSRSEIEGYRAGLKQCHNFLTLTQGPLTRRNGTEFIKSFGVNYCRVFGFQLTAESDLGEGFPIVFTDDNYLEVVGASGNVAGLILNTNPSFDNGLTDWTTVRNGPGTNGSVTASNGTVILEASTDTDTEDGFKQAVTIDPQYNNQDIDVSVALNEVTSQFDIYPFVRLKVGSTDGGNELADVTSGTKEINATVNVGTLGTIYVEVTIIGGDYSDVTLPNEPPEQGTRYRSVYDVNVRAPAIFQNQLIFTTTWTQADIEQANAYMPPDGERIYFLTPNKRPLQLYYNTNLDEWSLDEVTFTTKPDTWEDGSWPSCMTFYQGRAWWTGVKNEPNKIWSSVSALQNSDYQRIAVGSADDDSVVVTLFRRGLIKWIEGGDTLLVGNVYGEYSISSQGGLITPSDIKVQQQSSYGASSTKSMAIGTSVMYVSSDGRKLRTADFEWTRQKWTSKDLTFLAENLTENGSIQNMAYAKNPESVLWFSLSDGTALSATYEPFSGSIGWHTHEFAGTLKSLDTVEIAGKSVLYLMSNYNGSWQLHKLSETNYMDLGVDFTQESPTLTGLDHFEGQTVNVIVNGYYDGEYTVSSGSITVNLPEGYTGNFDATVGLVYESRMQPLEIDGTAPDGSTIPYKTRINKFKLRLIDSILPLINGVRNPTRTPDTPMGNVQPTFSGLMDLTQLGYQADDTYIISETLPFNVTITGVYTQVEQSQV